MLQVLLFALAASAATVPSLSTSRALGDSSGSLKIPVTRKLSPAPTLREAGVQVVDSERRRGASLRKREAIPSSFAVYSFVADIAVGSPSTTCELSDYENPCGG